MSTTQALRQPPAYAGAVRQVGQLGIHRSVSVRLTPNRLVSRGPMLSEALEPFRLHRRARYHSRRVAELSRPVADYSSDSDLEVGRADVDPQSLRPPGQVDIADLIGHEVHKQRLEQRYISSTQGETSSSTSSSTPAAAADLRAGTGAGPSSQGQNPEGSGPSSAADAAAHTNGCSAAAAAAEDGPSSRNQPATTSSSSRNISHRRPGHATVAHQHHPLHHSRSPLKGFHPPSSSDPTAAAAASSSSSSGPQDEELQPLLQPVLPCSSSSSSQEQQQQPRSPKMRGGIPNSIFTLSMVSMALTSASCVFNTLLPIYMVTELKMTMRSMGMFEGMLEAFSYVVRMFSGVVSDRLPSRKVAIAAGFFMGAAAKLGMSFSAGVTQLFIGKAIDRLGNGVQAAPRDALIGDLSPAASRSACFGFAQSMRKCGSFIGAGLAFALMKASGNNYQAIFMLAAGVSLAATLAFVLLVPSHPNTAHHSQQQQQQQGAAVAGGSSSSSSSSGVSFLEQAGRVLQDVKKMGKDFYKTMAVIALYGMGHINESLLEARAIEVGFGKAESTLVVALLCFSIFLCAYPMGRLDDKKGPRTTFALGMASLIAGDLVLMCSGSWPHAVFLACIFWGVHWAVVQGPMLAVVVGHAPSHLKGTAFGIFYTVMAVTAMAANSMFGTVWHTLGATTAFGLSAAIISVALLLLPWMLPERRLGSSSSSGRGGGGPQQQQKLKVAPA